MSNRHNQRKRQRIRRKFGKLAKLEESANLARIRKAFLARQSELDRIRKRFGDLESYRLSIVGEKTGKHQAKMRQMKAKILFVPDSNGQVKIARLCRLTAKKRKRILESPEREKANFRFEVTKVGSFQVVRNLKKSEGIRLNLISLGWKWIDANSPIKISDNYGPVKIREPKFIDNFWGNPKNLVKPENCEIKTVKTLTNVWIREN